MPGVLGIKGYLPFFSEFYGVGPNQHAEIIDYEANFGPYFKLRMPILGVKLGF